MKIKIVNVDLNAHVRVECYGQADIILGPGHSVVVADDKVIVEDFDGAQPVQQVQPRPAPRPAPVIEPPSPLIEAIGTSEPAEAYADAPIINGWKAGSDHGGPGYPVDPVPHKERKDPPNNGKTNHFDPNKGIAGMPPAKRRLLDDFANLR